MTSRFPVGATYAPLAKATEVPIEEWDNDIVTLAGLGLNTVRLFIAWDRIEQREGERDFARVDHAFALAERHGVQVIANVGGTFANLQAIYPPRWLLDERRCQQVVDAPGQGDPPPAPRIRLCYDDPAYQEAALDFIRAAVERYRGHPRLLAWSGWNEPRVAACFCPHTLALYRRWLEARYRTLDALGAAWSSEFPLSYRSWDEVMPQPRTGFEHGGYAPWLDWKAFCQQNRSGKFRLVADAIRSVDRAHPLLSHLCGPHDADIFDCEDVVGTSVYTYFHRGGERVELADGELARGLDWSTAQMALGNRPDRRVPDAFWVLETEAGPVSWVHNLMPRTYSARKMNARDMIFVAHGARGLLRWLYRSRISDAQAGEFNLVGWDGSVTARAQEFGRLAGFLDAHAGLFLASRPAPAEVALLAPGAEVKRLFEAEDCGGKYDDLARHWYAALADLGIPCALLNDRQLHAGGLAGVKALIVPMRPYVDADLAAVLERFVAGGGLLIAESPFATKDLRAVHWRHTPGAGLAAVFGVQVYDLDKLAEDACGGIPAFDFQAVGRVQGCTVEAAFADGTPAITANRHGAGRAVLFLSIVSARYAAGDPGAALRARLLADLAAAGVRPWHRVEGVAVGSADEVVVRHRALPDGRRLVVAVNFSRCARTIGLDFPGARPCVVGGADGEGACAVAGSLVRFAAGPYSWAVLTLSADGAPRPG